MLKPPAPKQHRAEVLIWSSAFIVLALIPAGTNHHFTLCIPTLLGIDGCMGCGIGQAIGLFLRGDLQGSLQSHLLGVPAVVVLVSRIFTLTVHSHKQQ